MYENEQGALSRTPDKAEGPGKYLSVAWIGEQADGGRAIGTWLDVIAAPNVAAAMETVRVCPHPSLVWVLSRSRRAYRSASQRLAAACAAAETRGSCR